jgi:putative oxidoreductase
MAQAFLVGRIIVGCYYLFSAYHHFADTSHLAHAASLHGVPLPQVAVLVAGVLLAIAGVSFLLGVFPEVGIASVVLFFVPVTVTMHAFWADTNAATRQADLINFTKNLALLGSSLMFMAIPRPWPYSVERRARLPRRIHVPV